MSENTLANEPSPDYVSRASALVSQAWADGYRPDPILTVSEWADEHRVLSQKAASEPGKWRTSRTPYLREIMDALSSSSSIRRVVFMKGAQVGGTEAGNNWIGYVIHHSPGPMMAVMPTVETAKRNSKQRIAPLVQECDVLRDLVKEPRARDSGNTVQSKEFPGGVLIMTGANSAVGLRSMPARYLFLDEVDGFPGDVDGEGDPIALAEARTRTFQRRKIFIVSTATVAGKSRIEREFLKSDQRRFFVPCPHCNHFQPLQFGQLRWNKGSPETAQYACEECGALCGEHHKTEMLRRGEWRATAPGEGKSAGFHLSSLYSPVGWMSWVEIAQRWEAAQGDQELLKEFINTVLGETWKDGAEAPKWQDVYARRGSDLAGSVSRRALVLFAGADVQKDRIEVSVWGFGRNRERWLVEHRVLPGETNRPQVWAGLAEMFGETWKHESGIELSVRDWGVDSGAFTSEVYAFVRDQKGRGNVHAVDGQDSYAGAFLGVGAKDANAAGKKLRRGLKTLRIGSSFCKQELLGALALDRPEGEAAFPAGFVHLPKDVTEDQVKQLTAEELTTRTRRGRTIREWSVITGRRNEVLDCANYARGLAAMRGWDRWRESHWRQIEDALGIERESIAPKAEMAAPAVVAGSLADRNLKRSARRSRVRKGPARW